MEALWKGALKVHTVDIMAALEKTTRLMNELSKYIYNSKEATAKFQNIGMCFDEARVCGVPVAAYVFGLPTGAAFLGAPQVSRCDVADWLD